MKAAVRAARRRGPEIAESFCALIAFAAISSIGLRGCRPGYRRSVLPHRLQAYVRLCRSPKIIEERRNNSVITNPSVRAWSVRLTTIAPCVTEDDTSQFLRFTHAQACGVVGKLRARYRETYRYRDPADLRAIPILSSHLSDITTIGRHRLVQYPRCAPRILLRTFFPRPFGFAPSAGDVGLNTRKLREHFWRVRVQDAESSSRCRLVIIVCSLIEGRGHKAADPGARCAMMLAAELLSKAVALGELCKQDHQMSYGQVIALHQSYWAAQRWWIAWALQRVYPNVLGDADMRARFVRNTNAQNLQRPSSLRENQRTSVLFVVNPHRQACQAQCVTHFGGPASGAIFNQPSCLPPPRFQMCGKSWAASRIADASASA